MHAVYKKSNFGQCLDKFVKQLIDCAVLISLLIEGKGNVVQRSADYVCHFFRELYVKGIDFALLPSVLWDNRSALVVN
jgi:hypothetical protein